VLVGLGQLSKGKGDFIGMQNRSQLPLDERIAFGPLHLDGLIEELTAPQMIQDEVQEIDMRHAYVWFLLGNVVQEELDVVADPQFVFRRVIKDIEGNLVADAFATQESVRGHFRQYLIESVN
jgi:hypothetical protein